MTPEPGAVEGVVSVDIVVKAVSGLFVLQVQAQERAGSERVPYKGLFAFLRRALYLGRC